MPPASLVSPLSSSAGSPGSSRSEYVSVSEPTSSSGSVDDFVTPPESPCGSESSSGKEYLFYGSTPGPDSELTPEVASVEDSPQTIARSPNGTQPSLSDFLTMPVAGPAERWTDVQTR